MIREASDIPRDTQLTYDLCVVGAGAAGISIALEMDGSPFRVLVLESGGMTPDDATQDLHNGFATGLPYFSPGGSRLRFFGGTTNHWGGLCKPFVDIDFQVQPGVRHSGWPIGSTDIAGHYGRAAEICNLASLDPFDTALDGAAESTDFGPHFRPRIMQRIPNAQRRFRLNHREQLRVSPNVDVLLGANLTRFDNTLAGNVDRARVATLGGNSLMVTARAYVLATGAIENARLLLASGDREKGGLGNQNDVVGRYFLEHPRFVAAHLLPADPNMSVRFYDWHRNRGATVRAYLSLTAERRRSLETPGARLRLRPEYAGSYRWLEESEPVRSFRRVGGRIQGAPGTFGDLGNDIGVVMRDLMKWQSATAPGAPLPVPRPAVLASLFRGTSLQRSEWSRRAFGDLAAMVLRRWEATPVDSVEVTTVLQQVPNPESRVVLAAESDALGVPRAHLQWHLTEVDRRSLDTVMNLLGAEVGRLGIGRLRLTYDPSSPSWPEALRGGYHQMGTTRMSSDPRFGVVDRNLRVHDSSNLFVAGSSVFPTGGDGAPTMILVALAIRLADHLKGVLA